METKNGIAFVEDADFLYKLIWAARSTEDLRKKKRLWYYVGLLSLMRYYIGFPLLFLISDYIFRKADKDFSSEWLVLLLVMMIFIEGLAYRKELFERASIFYAIAVDFKRTSLSENSKILFLLSGGLSLFFALYVWHFWGKRLHRLYVTDLDVLGSIFSKAKFWKMAHKIFEEIEKRYLARNQNHTDRRQACISFALASKWMLDDPYATAEKKLLQKAAIRNILENEKDLPPEITARLYEALGEDSQMRHLYQEI